jgi:hypothetical protein
VKPQWTPFLRGFLVLSFVIAHRPRYNPPHSAYDLNHPGFPMFPDSLKPVVMILWLIWAALLFGGFIFGTTNKEGTRRIPRWNRLGSSLALVVAAWFYFWIAKDLRNPDTILYIPLELIFFIALGMTLGCLGDFFMAEIFPIKNYVLGGIGSFGLGHIAYIIGAISIYIQTNTPLVSTFPLFIIWWPIAVGLWYMVVYRGSEKSGLHYAALPYAILLASTAAIATATTLQVQDKILLDTSLATIVNVTVLNWWFPALMTIGATLFLISDLILATRLFNHARSRLIDDVVWLTYGPGQMLIVYSVIAPVLLTS